VIPESPPEETDEGSPPPAAAGSSSTRATRGGNLAVLAPGEPNSMYHWETETEAFFVISGEALLIVEGQELRYGSGTSCTALPRRDT
jgi:uncharacterized cupin superfamily protein